METQIVLEKRNKKADRLFFIDNIRVLLTILVLLVHSAITYGPAGDWYYKETAEDIVTIIVLSWFVCICKSFFMGLFFMISGFFTPGSFNRKGWGGFLRDRFIRLGIPLLLYAIIVEPFMNYVFLIKGKGMRLSYMTFINQYVMRFEYIGSGTLWFVQTLLILAVAYAVYRTIFKKTHNEPESRIQFPKNHRIIMYALLLSMITFIVRFWYPIGQDFFSMELGFFPQYVSLFIIGIIVYHNNWMQGITDKMGKMWLKITAGVILFWPVMLISGGAMEGDFEPFMGGPTWQAFVYCFWEGFLCVGMCISLIYLFNKRYSKFGVLGKAMSDNAYSVYIIHSPILVFIAYCMMNLSLHPLAKFTIVSLLGIPVTFLSSHYIFLKLPFARKIL